MHCIPTLHEFLEVPSEEVARVAPKTLIFAPGGTRRSAALAGIAPHSEQYAQWTRKQQVACIEQMFRLGIQHVFMNVLRPPQVAEVGRYRERLFNWLDWGLAGPEALEDYARIGCRARMLGTVCVPELQAAAARLEAATTDPDLPTVWYYVMPEFDSPWKWILAALQRTQGQSTEDIKLAIYGESLPPATMYLGFGKPMVGPDLLPPLLVGELQCYWTQRPGYDVGEAALRQIIYDYAYLRPTWMADKSQRYSELPRQRSLWEQGCTIGLGQRIGPFWYPLAAEQPNDTSVLTV